MAKIIDFVSEQGLKPASLLKMAFPNVLKTVNPTEPKRNDVESYEPFSQFEIAATVLLTFIVIFLVLIMCSLCWCNKNTVSSNIFPFSIFYMLILLISLHQNIITQFFMKRTKNAVVNQHISNMNTKVNIPLYEEVQEAARVLVTNIKSSNEHRSVKKEETIQQDTIYQITSFYESDTEANAASTGYGKGREIDAQSVYVHYCNEAMQASKKN
jgi:hypothetical protein